MLVLKKIAITGGLASGKSTVGRLFKSLGAFLLDTDRIVHKLLNNSSIQKQVIELLGNQVKRDKTLNRNKIAELVFKDLKKLDRLEKILHPRVREEVEKKYREISKENKWNLFVVEIPLLFETGAHTFYDQTIAVIADHTICEKRFCKRKSDRTSSYELRAQRQLSQEQKAKKADFILYNSGSLRDLKESFQKIYPKIIH